MSEKPAETEKRVTNNNKKPYTKPVLLSFGEVQTVTLGGTPGAGESGGTIPYLP